MVEEFLIDLAAIASILILAVALAVGTRLIIKRYLIRIVERTSIRTDRPLLQILEGPLPTFIFVLGSILAVRYWHMRFPRTFPEWLSVHFDSTATAVGVLLATSIISLMASNLIIVQIKRVTEGSPERETTFRLLNRLATLFIYSLGVFAALTVLIPPLTSSLTTILFGAGFLGIVLGMAAQRVLGNLLSGISVNITHPIRLNDAVVVRGEYGVVEDMDLHHTVIRTWDNRRMIIPNSVLDDEVIINYTLKDQKKLYPILIYVPYDADADKAGAIMVDEARKHPDVLAEMAPTFQVLDFSEGAITLRLLFAAKDQGTAFKAACDLRLAIKRRFDKEGVALSRPTRYIVHSGGDAARLSGDIEERRVGS